MIKINDKVIVSSEQSKKYCSFFKRVEDLTNKVLYVNCICGDYGVYVNEKENTKKTSEGSRYVPLDYIIKL